MSHTRPFEKSTIAPRCLLLLLLLIGLPTGTSAADHTWTSVVVIQSGTVTLPRVTITGSTINWGAGEWDNGFTESPSTVTPGGMSIATAIAQSKQRAINASSVCTNPAISSASKSVTSQSETVDRWLAAMNLFNTMVAQGLYGMYQASYGSTGIRMIIDGKSYQGYKVTYSDGATETWVINPGWQTSSIKLFDSPAPNSLSAPNPNAACQSSG